MPIRSPGDVPPGMIHDLGLPGRAVTALTRAGVTDVEDLALLTRRDLAAINGLGSGMIAAIRLVVPEPSASFARSRVSPEAERQELAFPAIDPEPEPDEQESPAAPVMPSFDSLRAPRRRSAFDVLMPEAPPARSVTGPAPSRVARPPEYADLLRLGVHVARALADVPRRVGLWSLRQPVHCLRRLLGEQVSSRPVPSGD
jgi:hypothetical protein